MPFSQLLAAHFLQDWTYNFQKLVAREDWGRHSKCCVDLGWGINEGEDEMPPSHNVIHVYDPAALKMMTVAFESAWQSLPANFKDSERARRKLALLVLRHVDRGEQDPTCLADMALLDFLK